MFAAQFQTFEDSEERGASAARLAALRAELRRQNLDGFKGSTWSPCDRCLELSDIELHRVVERLEEAGLTVRFYGRLRGWDGKSPIWRALP